MLGVRKTGRDDQTGLSPGFYPFLLLEIIPYG